MRPASPSTALQNRGIIHKVYIKKVKTIDSKVYSEVTLPDSERYSPLTLLFKVKCSNEFQQKKVMFHQDNARPNVCALTGLDSVSTRMEFLDVNLIRWLHRIRLTSLLWISHFFTHAELHFVEATFNYSQDVRNYVDPFFTLAVTKFLGRSL